jgi:hypothetical protein
MKYRVSDTDLIDLDKVDFIEVDGKTINFYLGTELHQSIYSSETEAKCIFQNINNHFNMVDFRISKDESIVEEVKESTMARKTKAFDMFWSLYNKKTDMPRTKKSFINLTLREMGLAIKGVEPYVNSTPDKKYRKNPCTWINQKGWENELIISADGKSSEVKNTNLYKKPNYITDDR